MYITAAFTKDGVPETGLSPTIRIRRVSDNVLLITDAAMSEIGDGEYKYFFATYDKDIEYMFRCDGGLSLPDTERYTFGVNDNFVEDIDEHLSDAHGYGSWEFSDITGVIDANIVSVQGSPVTNVNDFKADLTTLETLIRRVLGLVQENFYIDQTVFNSNGLMTESRIRIYSNAASVGSNSNVIAEYDMEATYNNDCEMQTYSVKKSP